MSEVSEFAETVQADPLYQGLWVGHPEARYHADPAPEPSLSASGAKTLINRSPRAFQWKHPRLRPARLPPIEESTTDQQVFGTVVHKLVLGRGRDVVEVDADDWRSKAAKQERADIHAVGKIAILKAKMAEAKALAREVRAQGVAYDEREGLVTEAVLVWQDAATDGTPVWCRSMLDVLDLHAGQIDDLKVTGAELSEAFVVRQIDAMGYDVSMAFYRRGLSRVVPDLAGRIKTRLRFIERNEPFDTFDRDLTEGDLHQADLIVQQAIDRFAACMTAGAWPGAAANAHGMSIPDWRKRAALYDLAPEGESA